MSKEKKTDPPAAPPGAAPDGSPGAGRLLDKLRPVAGWVWRRSNIVILLLIAGVLLALAFTDTPQRRGDGNEYFQMMFSWALEGSSELTDDSVAEYRRLRAEAASSSISFESDQIFNPSPHDGYVDDHLGVPYAVHFWLYSLTAVPALWLLRATGQDQLLALQVTNACLLIGAAAVLLFFSGFNRYQKWLAAALFFFSPAMWYLDWSGPEIFSAALVLAGVALFSRHEYALAVLAAALASTQNPPLMILLLFFLIYGAVATVTQARGDNLADQHKYRPLAQGGLLATAALPALIPMVFYVRHFGSTNLIYESGGAALSYISLDRFLSTFFDLNQGMLPFIPGILFFFVFLLLRNRGKEGRIYELLLLTVLMVIVMTTTANWNSDAEGIMRYDVWILPLLIWGLIEGADLSRRTDRIFFGAVIAVQMVIVFSYPAWFIPQRPTVRDPADFLQHNALATYVLDKHAWLYNPEPEIFSERTWRRESASGLEVPVAYFAPSGDATKILTNYSGLMSLSGQGDADPAFLREQLAAHRGESGNFYINPSPGQMRAPS